MIRKISLPFVMRVALAVLLATLVCGQPARAQRTTPFKNLAAYVKWVQSKHKAPFDRDGSVLPQDAAKALKERATAALSAAVVQFQNDRVNQDKNPWPKAEIAATGYDLSLNRYKEVTHDVVDHVSPSKILQKLADLELDGLFGLLGALFGYWFLMRKERSAIDEAAFHSITRVESVPAEQLAPG